MHQAGLFRRLHQRGDLGDASPSKTTATTESSTTIDRAVERQQGGALAEVKQSKKAAKTMSKRQSGR
jgi:hypothetical protein